jgi:hypothetical protein
MTYLIYGIKKKNVFKRKAKNEKVAALPNLGDGCLASAI